MIAPGRDFRKFESDRAAAPGRARSGKVNRYPLTVDPRLIGVDLLSAEGECDIRREPSSGQSPDSMINTMITISRR